MKEQAYFKDQKQWAVILGGSSGMGLATARKLASEGMNICLLHRDRRQELPTIEEAFEGIRKEGVSLLAYNIDALKVEKRSLVLEGLKNEMGEAGKVKVLVHSIAKGNLKPMQSEGEEPVLKQIDFELTLNAMALSLYGWVQSIYEMGMFSKTASVIGLTSEGSSRVWASYGAVSVAKAALEALCRSMALEFAPFGLRVNVIQAGVTDTLSMRMIPGSEKLLKEAKRRNPFKRLTRTDDIANVIFLLCRKEANWINGTILKVDGGESIVA